MAVINPHIPLCSCFHAKRAEKDGKNAELEGPSGADRVAQIVPNRVDCVPILFGTVFERRHNANVVGKLRQTTPLARFVHCGLGFLPLTAWQQALVSSVKNRAEQD